MRIAKLAPSQHKQGRWLVHLENGDLLRVTENEVVAFALYAGMDLDEETKEALTSAAETARHKEYALNLLSARPLSRRELVKKQDIRDSLYRRYASGEVSRQDFREFKRIFTKDCEEVEQAIELQQRELDRMLESSTPDSPWIEHFRQFGQLDALTREALVRLVERVLVYEGDRIEIVFRYQEQFTHAMAYLAEAV